MLEPWRGRVRYRGRAVAARRPRRWSAWGSATSPQTENILGSLSVAENLRMGGVSRGGGLEAVLGDLYDRFPLLDEKRSPKPPTLSGGQWQVLALVRALDTDPFVLLAGEPRRDWRPTPPTRCSMSSGWSTSSGPPSSWFNRMPGGAVHRRPEVRPQPGHCPPAGDGSPHLGSLWRVAVTPATMVLGYQSFTGSGRQVGSDDDMYTIPWTAHGEAPNDAANIQFTMGVSPPEYLTSHHVSKQGT